jgi:flagellar basal body-associated protein FliL
MTDELVETKVKDKFKVLKVLIVVLSILLLVGTGVVVSWKMGGVVLHTQLKGLETFEVSSPFTCKILL